MCVYHQKRQREASSLETERGKESARVRERVSGRKRGRETEKQRVCVRESGCVRERERKNKRGEKERVYACARVRERDGAHTCERG